MKPIDSRTQACLARGGEAFQLLFGVADETGKLVYPADVLSRFLAQQFFPPQEGGAVAAFNALEAVGDLGAALEARIFERFIALHQLPGTLTERPLGDDARFLLNAAADLFEAVRLLPEQLTEEERERIFPRVRKAWQNLTCHTAETLAETLPRCDLFRTARTFVCHHGKFLPKQVQSAKAVTKFFGFASIRAHFLEHFRDFAGGKSNLPLFINSLPGYGKTSLTISHVLAEENLVLILPDPAALEGDWESLVAPLAARPDLKFVLFFDDIDPRETDWYSFRTHVGGAFSLPANVMPVLAANYEFPANVLSRGKKLSFPIFDELRCMEMVEDFLTDFGMKHLNRNLVSLIAADYTEEYGQKHFTELSPRSLVRYLQIYYTDRIKRKTIVELSFSQLITRPDAQLFYEFNIELMRSLYGDAYIERLRKEELKAMEG